MQNELFNSVVDYLKRQKALGRDQVFRAIIVEVMWYNRGLIKDPNNPVELTRQLLKDASAQVQGTYIYDQGRARIVF